MPPCAPLVSFRITATVLAAFLVSGIARAEAGKRLNVSRDSGREFVAALKFVDATIDASDARRVRFHNPGDSHPHELKRSALKVFDEAAVSDKPLELLKDVRLDVGERVRIARAGQIVYVMRRTRTAPADGSQQLSVGTETPDSADAATRIPTLEEVRDVLRLDSKEKRERFEQLDEETRRNLLIIAGNIAGLKDVPRMVSIKLLKRHVELFDKEKIRNWLVGIANAAGVDSLLDTLKTPPARRDTVRMAFAGLTPQDRQRSQEIARKIKTGGLSALAADEREFVKRNRLIFDAD